MGNLVDKERLLPHGWLCLPCADEFSLGIDRARSSDHTRATLTSDSNDVIRWFKHPLDSHEEQMDLLSRDLKRMGVVNKVYGVRGDAIGQGLMPIEHPAARTALPVYEESMFTFTMQSKARLRSHFQETL